MNTRELAKKAVRQQIALAASKRFQENGFDNTTVEEISRDMGMSTRTFFRYFPTKEDAVLEPVYAFKAQFLACFERSLAAHDLWTALESALRDTVIECEKNDPLQHGPAMQVLIRATPTLFARQLEIVEQLQNDATDLYLSVCAPTGKYGWATTNAMVRSGFACWHALEASRLASDNGRAAETLQTLMGHLKPAALLAR